VALRAGGERRLAPARLSVRRRADHDRTTGITGADGETSAELVAGRSYARPAGVEHDVRNDSDGEFVFIEIEIKARA